MPFSGFIYVKMFEIRYYKNKSALLGLRLNTSANTLLK